jgi:ABC-2 type transport system ATP-binding protein
MHREFDGDTGPVVQFDGVGKIYPRGGLGKPPILALAGVTFDVPRGQVLGLLGPNRAGKTTLLKILLSVAKPTEGKVLRFGRPWSDRSGLAKIGYVHENHAFPKYLSATELLNYYGTLGGIEGSVLRERTPQLLDRVGLADRAKEPIGRFSKGMVQRLGLAQALINDPELLVLDEPTEGLDFEGRRTIRKLVDEWRNGKRTVILVTHTLSEVELLCDAVAVLNKGRLIHHGEREKLQRGRSLEAALEKLYLEGKAA